MGCRYATNATPRECCRRKKEKQRRTMVEGIIELLLNSQPSLHPLSRTEINWWVTKMIRDFDAAKISFSQLLEVYMDALRANQYGASRHRTHVHESMRFLLSRDLFSSPVPASKQRLVIIRFLERIRRYAYKRPKCDGRTKK